MFILPNINLELKSALRTKYLFYQSLLYFVYCSVILLPYTFATDFMIFLAVLFPCFPIWGSEKKPLILHHTNVEETHTSEGKPSPRLVIARCHHKCQGSENIWQQEQKGWNNIAAAKSSFFQEGEILANQCWSLTLTCRGAINGTIYKYVSIIINDGYTTYLRKREW